MENNWRRITYSTGDIEAMQKDALNRVRMMREQAEQKLKHTNESIHNESFSQNFEYNAPNITPMPSMIEEVMHHIDSDKTKNAEDITAETKYEQSPSNIPQSDTQSKQQVHSMPLDAPAPSLSKSIKDSAIEFGENISEKFSNFTSPLTNIMDSFGIDSDKLLIIGLIIVLLNEKSDKTLLLALGYILFMS